MARSLATLPHRRDLAGQMVGRGWTQGVLTVCSMFPTLNAMAGGASLVCPQHKAAYQISKNVWPDTLLKNDGFTK